MTRRIFPDNDAWSSEASRASNEVTVAFADILAILEEDGPVDLKDFHYIISSAAGTFVSGLSISRRLGDPDTPPDPIIHAYPRLHTSTPAIRWDCEDSPTGKCQYDDIEDPAWDNCIHCDWPYDRK
tara:strand:- start:639 stop:1016 length:378 start_codon:yes stop_codon:yes gene_type:complete